MITAEDFVLELNNTEESNNFKLATVTSLFANKTAKVQFDGEDTSSEKQYAYLASYVPKTLDRVLLGVLGGTYVILGKVNYNISPSTEEELDRYLFDQKLVTMTKALNVTGNSTFNSNLTISGLASLNGGASISGSIGINGDITGVNISATGTITASGLLKGGSISTTGGLAAGASTLSSLTVSNSASFRGNIGFFSTGAQSKKNCYRYVTGSEGGTLAGTINKLNELILVLHDYGLIRGV